MDNPILHSNIGDCYFNMKNYSTAMRHYRRAINIKKDYANAYYNLGGCYIMLRHKAKAINIWQTGLKYSPGDQKLINALRKYLKTN